MWGVYLVVEELLEFPKNSAGDIVRAIANADNIDTCPSYRNAMRPNPLETSAAKNHPPNI